MQGETATSNVKDLSSGQIPGPLWMGMLTLGSGVVVLVYWGAATAAAFVLGAWGGILNYRWLHRAVYSVLEDPSKRVPKRLVIRILLRYPLVLGLILLLYWTQWLPVLGVIGGLFVPIAVLMVGSAVYLFTGGRSL